MTVGFEQCVVSELTIAELYVGVYKGGNLKQKKEVEFVKNRFEILPISTAIETYAKVRSSLELSGIKIDSMDCLIASTAIINGLVLVTHNSKHFSRIESLEIEDWEK